MFLITKYSRYFSSFRIWKRRQINGKRNLPRMPMKVGNITRRVAGEPDESACPGRDTGALTTAGVEESG